MELEAGLCGVRPGSSVTERRWPKPPNDYEVWRNLADRLPHPYTVEDAGDWIACCISEGGPPRNCAIVVDGQAVGGIGLDLPGYERRHRAYVGYWLARRLWNQGIATAALRRFSEYAFEAFDLERLQASVFV